jgi:hypothetical protein
VAVGAATASSGGSRDSAGPSGPRPAATTMEPLPVAAEAHQAAAAVVPPQPATEVEPQQPAAEADPQKPSAEVEPQPRRWRQRRLWPWRSPRHQLHRCPSRPAAQRRQWWKSPTTTSLHRAGTSGRARPHQPPRPRRGFSWPRAASAQRWST